MAIRLFGFTIGKESEEKSEVASPIPPENEDGSVGATEAAGAFLSLETSTKNETQLIARYRTMAQYPEVDSAIDDIVHEIVSVDERGDPVEINLDSLEVPDAVKDKIRDEFDEILRLLRFTERAYDVVRNWYVDGRLYYYILIDKKNPRKGIQELRKIDPRYVRKIRQEKKVRQTVDPNTKVAIPRYEEYFLFSKDGKAQYGGQTIGQTIGSTAIKLSKDSVSYVPSGVLDPENTMVLSHLHKAIKPLNQLRWGEDAAVVYRLARAPERKVFYVDVGNLPRMKAEQHLRDMMNKHKNRLTYDSATGEITDERKFMSMIEDYWLARREGGRGTEVTTLPGGENLGQIEDIEYFQRKLYKALNVPASRLDSEAGFNLGRSSEITRDEVKFTRFIRRLRAKFSTLFIDLLGKQLQLKGVLSKKDWEKLRNRIYFQYSQENFFTELKEQEITASRFQLLRDVEEFRGQYASREWIWKNVLRFTDEDIEKEKLRMEEEKKEDPDLEDDAEA